MRRGLTLLELVVVLVILGLALGLAIPILRSAAKSLAVPSARTYVASMIKSARDTARIESTPTWVLIETNSAYCTACNQGVDVGSAVGGTDMPCPTCKAKIKVPDRTRGSGRSLSVISREPVSQWHFEDLAALATTGLNDQKASVKTTAKPPPSNLLVDGKIGRAIRLDGRTWIETPNIPIYHPQQGVAVEFWLFRDDFTNRQTVLTLGSTLTVLIEQRSQDVRDCPKCGKLIPNKEKVCGLCGQTVSPVSGVRRNAVVVVAKAGSTEVATAEQLPSMQWVKVEIACVAGEIRIYVDDVFLAAKPGALTWSKEVPLVFGARENGVRALVDELSLDLIVPRDSYQLPPDIVFGLGPGARPNASGQLIVTFDREGRLDRSRHSRPIQLKILSGEGEEAGLQVELNGTIPK